MEMMAARKNGSGNRSSIDESDPVNPGTVTENTHDDSVDYDCHDNVGEKNALGMGLGPKIQQNVQDNIELNEGILMRDYPFPKWMKGKQIVIPLNFKVTYNPLIIQYWICMGQSLQSPKELGLVSIGWILV